MEFYVITEIIENVLNGVYTTTNNHIKNKEDAINMFLTRTAMLIDSSCTNKILKQQFNINEVNGITKVELSNGCILELTIAKLTLV